MGKYFVKSGSLENVKIINLESDCVYHALLAGIQGDPKTYKELNSIYTSSGSKRDSTSLENATFFAYG